MPDFEAFLQESASLRRETFLPLLPIKGCAYDYTVLLASDHRTVLEDKYHFPAPADARLTHCALPQRFIHA